MVLLGSKYNTFFSGFNSVIGTTLLLYPKNVIIRLEFCFSVGILIEKFPSLLLMVEMLVPETVMLAKISSFFVLLSKTDPLNCLNELESVKLLTEKRASVCI